jgi:hypothetical protein
VLMRLAAGELERGGIVVLGAIIVLGLGADRVLNKLLLVIA